MRHIKLTLQYDGTNYSGWQSQTNAPAIQDVVSGAVRKMVEEPVVLGGASRTDAGVHALGQVACFLTERDISCRGFLRGLNSFLPEDIRVVACEEVGLDFHPIGSAKSKTYEYLLETSEVPSPILRNRVWSVGPKINLDAMKRASQYLLGEHDFKSFQGADSDAKTTGRRVKTIEINPSPLPLPQGERVSLQFSANGFLKYMVRNIVGTLVEVGLGRLQPEEVQKILAAKDRTQAGPTAPPQGLYLLHVQY